MARPWPRGSEWVLLKVAFAPAAELVAAGRVAVLEGDGEIEVAKVVRMDEVVAEEDRNDSSTDAA